MTLKTLEKRGFGTNLIVFYFVIGVGMHSPITCILNFKNVFKLFFLTFKNDGVGMHSPITCYLI